MIPGGVVSLPIKLITTSSEVQATQEHNNAGPQTATASSVDGPIVLKQFVKKPIFQYVYESIHPSRKIVQEVLPVKEVIKTIVAKDHGANGHWAHSTSAPEEEAPATSTPEEAEGTTHAFEYEW